MSRVKQLALHLRWFLVALLAVGAFLSLRAGIRGAIASSGDFQWAGAFLFRNGVDPWNDALTNHSHIAHFTQPTYPHMLYILLLPLSMLSFQHAIELWCCLNILLSVACVLLLKKLFSLSRIVSISALLLLWISAPYRATLQRGQASLVELLLLCIVFSATNSTLRGAALGLSFSTYLFAPVAVSFLWFKRHILTLTIGVFALFLGLILTWCMVGGSVVQLAFEPFAVARLNASPGMADLVTTIELALAGLFPAFTSGPAVAWIAGLFAAGAFGFFLSRRQVSPGGYLVLVAVAGLFTAKHLMVDYTFLLVPLCYAMSVRGKPVRLVALPIIGACWYMDKIFESSRLAGAPALTQGLTSAAACCMLGSLLVFLTWSVLRTECVRGVEPEVEEEKGYLSPTALSPPNAVG